MALTVFPYLLVTYKVANDFSEVQVALSRMSWGVRDAKPELNPLSTPIARESVFESHSPSGQIDELRSCKTTVRLDLWNLRMKLNCFNYIRMNASDESGCCSFLALKLIDFSTFHSTSL